MSPQTDYDALPYQQVIFKASHNSYQQKASIATQLSFDPKDTYDEGCRGLEFDLHRHSGGPIGVNEISADFWTVDHIGNGGLPFSTYLQQLIDWHRENPNHDPIWVTLDLKSSHGGDDTFPEELDNYLLTFFFRNLIMSVKDLFPNFTAEGGQKLSDVVSIDGWPTLGAMRGKFILCISGNTDDWKKKYYQTDPVKRLCLVDSKDINELNHSNSRVVYNQKAGSGNQADFKQLEGQKMLIRVYDVDTEGDWTKSTNMGTSILATNVLTGYSWACVSQTEPFGLRATPPANS